MSVLAEAGRLTEAGTPFALATVVAVERPSSARVGDRALVTTEGELHGWVGGACTEPEVVRLALEALAGGEVRRERIESRCASEGAVEVLIDPQRPALLLAVLGDSPAARTLRGLAARARVARVARGSRCGRGRDRLDGSGRRGGAGCRPCRRSRLHRAGRELETGGGGSGRAGSRRGNPRPRALPAGLDLGPSSQEEIAVAILAELVAWQHTRSKDVLQETQRSRLWHDGRGCRRPVRARARRHDPLLLRPRLPAQVRGSARLRGGTP